MDHSQEQVNEIEFGLLDSKMSFCGRKKQHVFPKQVRESTRTSTCSFFSGMLHGTLWWEFEEAIALGVPVLAFPSFGNHLTNAKFLLDVFGIGVSLSCCGAGNDKLVTRVKWKKAADDAVAVSGSPDRHLSAFLHDINISRNIVNFHQDLRCVYSDNYFVFLTEFIIMEANKYIQNVCVSSQINTTR